MTPFPDLIAQGFSLGFVTLVFAWGMTICWRWFARLLGF
jgi:hypothetical protein